LGACIGRCQPGKKSKRNSGRGDHVRKAVGGAQSAGFSPQGRRILEWPAFLGREKRLWGRFGHKKAAAFGRQKNRGGVQVLSKTTKKNRGGRGGGQREIMGGKGEETPGMLQKTGQGNDLNFKREKG